MDELSLSSKCLNNTKEKSENSKTKPAQTVKENSIRQTSPVQCRSVTSDETNSGSANNVMSTSSHSTRFNVPSVHDRQLTDTSSTVMFPETDTDEDASSPLPKVKTISLMQQKLRRYFGSKKFVVVSNLFGTAVAFFLVAKRVESFLHSQGILSNRFVSFRLPLRDTFWILVCWLSLFLCCSTIVQVSMPNIRRLKTVQDRKIVVAAILDAILTTSCFVIFLVAESQRCCYADEGTERYLGETGVQENENMKDYSIEEMHNGHICSCPSFGTRTYGGLGNLEPFTSLIALRVFRHYIAKRIVVNFWNPKPEKDDEIDVTQEIVSPFSVFDETHDEHHIENSASTAAELWKAAITRHPELASKYGEFSSEILRAMLGVAPSKPDSGRFSLARGRTSRQGNNHDSNKFDHSVTSFEGTPRRQTADSVHSYRPTYLRFNSGMSNSAKDDPPHLPNPDSTSVESEFIAPTARLVRNMRRCDRKLLPILDKWTPVDVVMTRFEIVYFDAMITDAALDPIAKELKKTLITTSGGKQLRLCDVAAGRRVVGHLLLADIQSIVVDRYFPGASDQNDDGSSLLEDYSEFWQTSKSRPSMAFPAFPVGSTTWNCIRQDVLRIKTIYGRTFCLRFYSDVDGAIKNRDQRNDQEESSELIKIQALHWAQTIGRICGPDISKFRRQCVPNVDDASAELRNYIIEHRPNHEKSRRFHLQPESPYLPTRSKLKLFSSSQEDVNEAKNDILRQRSFVKRPLLRSNTSRRASLLQRRTWSNLPYLNNADSEDDEKSQNVEQLKSLDHVADRTVDVSGPTIEDMFYDDDDIEANCRRFEF